MGTKGTWRRPTAVDEDRLARNWRLAFGQLPLIVTDAAGASRDLNTEVAEPTENC